MWWRREAVGRYLRAAAALAVAALAAGCFQPLYGERAPTGGAILRDQLSAVDVIQIPYERDQSAAIHLVEARPDVAPRCRLRRLSFATATSTRSLRAGHFFAVTYSGRGRPVTFAYSTSESKSASLG